VKKSRTRPDYASLERPWEDFTDDELSMIASHLAGGGAFCCHEHRFERATVTASHRRQHILADHAYDRWGCSSSMVRTFGEGYVKERQDVATAHYLEKFLQAI
jgi:hypothetical protein